MTAIELPSRLTGLAGNQDGVITRSQALDAGLTPARWRSGAGGTLQTVFRGCAVLTRTVGADGLSPRQLARAATLATGNPTRAVLCLGSALREVGIEGSPYQDAEHLLHDRGWHPRAGIQRHSFEVPDSDLCEIRGLTLTTPKRSVYDALRSYDRAHSRLGDG